MFLMRACGSQERSSLQWSMRGRIMSSANFVWPVHFCRASTLRKGLPTTRSSAPSLPLPFLPLDPLPFPFLLITVDDLPGWQSVFSAHSCRRQLDGLVNLYVARAAAEIARKSFL